MQDAITPEYGRRHSLMKYPRLQTSELESPMVNDLFCNVRLVPEISATPAPSKKNRSDQATSTVASEKMMAVYNLFTDELRPFFEPKLDNKTGKLMFDFQPLETFHQWKQCSSTPCCEWFRPRVCAHLIKEICYKT